MRRGSEQTFFQRRHRKGQQVQEKVLNITNHQENAIKIIIKYHLTPVRMVITKKKTRKTNVGKNLENWNPGAWLGGAGGMQSNVAYVENSLIVWQFLQNVNIE